MVWGVGLGALFLILGLRRHDRKGPAPLVALLITLATLGLVYASSL